MENPIVCRHDPQVSCADCALSQLCLPPALTPSEIQRLNDIVGRNRPLQKGDYLYRQDAPFSAIYAVRVGCLKSYRISGQGIEHIAGFYLPGEIVGLDGIGANRHATSAIALETSSVCRIPFDRLKDLGREIPTLQNRCFQLMSQEIVEDQILISLLSKHRAEARIAAFFLSISERKLKRELSWSEFSLAMSRSDMASYLGLTIETTSRVLSKLQKSKILKVNNKNISILDICALKNMASASQ